MGELGLKNYGVFSLKLDNINFHFGPRLYLRRSMVITLVCLSVCLSVRPSVRPSVHQSSVTYHYQIFVKIYIKFRVNKVN